MPSSRASLLLLSTILLSTFLGVSAGRAEGALTLAAAVEQAIEHNPELRRARVEVGAAEQARTGAGAPAANPALTVEAGPRFTPTGPQADVGVSLEIPIDLGATSRRRRAASSAQLDAARAQLAWVELGVATAARVLFAEAVAGDARVVAEEEAVALAHEMERVARRRHELGEVSVLEPNFAGLERTEAQGALLSARRDRAVAYRALGALLALPANAPLTLVPGAAPSWPESLAPSVEALSEGLARRPDLVAATERARAAEAQLAAARGQGAPGMSASAGWVREGDEANVVTGALRFELPLQRNQLGVAEAGAAAGLAGIDAEVAAQAAFRSLADALDGWQAAAARHALATSEALPLAQESLALVLRAYEAGKEELLGVLLMQRQALTARRAAIDAELELHRAAAALERAVGQEVF